MEVKDGDYISTVWYAAIENQDMLATLFKRKDKDYFEIEYRFRYYVDDEVFDSKDHKSWWHIKFKPEDTEQYAIDSFTGTCEAMHKIGYGKPTIVPIKGGMKEYMHEMMAQPFTHMMRLSKEEAEKRGVKAFNE